MDSVTKNSATQKASGKGDFNPQRSGTSTATTYGTKGVSGGGSKQGPTGKFFGDTPTKCGYGVEGV